MTQREQIKSAAETALIDIAYPSNLAYRPQFISNNHEAGKKVLSTIEEELLSCDSFAISVAFITMGGIVPLLQTFKELEKRGVPGRIITTDYLNFSEPKALTKLSGLSNIRLKMFQSERAEVGFHTKGYIFKEGKVYKIITGSSNMTLSALTVNKEWNSRVVALEEGEYTQQVLREFEELWNSKWSLGHDEFIEEYSERYEIIRKQRRIAKEKAEKEHIISFEEYTLQPNSMQTQFVTNLKKIWHKDIEEGRSESRALLVSATGTGKTYASAFALRDLMDETDAMKDSEDVKRRTRALFIVHREQIAKQARKSYRRVFGGTRTTGLLSGNSREFDKDITFATMQMMAREDIRTQFNPDEFSIIVIDEAHKSGAESYQRIMDYFKPRLYLGMTATPDRTDGFDIYKLFNHNIAYEIRLQQALEEDLLCPFHYFGITDITIGGEEFDDSSYAGSRNGIDFRMFNRLTSDARVDYIMEQAAYYGYSGDRVKGLIFVSRRDIGEELSRKLNARGLRTQFVSGSDPQEKREKYLDMLTRDADSDNEINICKRETNEKAEAKTISPYGFTTSGISGDSVAQGNHSEYGSNGNNLNDDALNNEDEGYLDYIISVDIFNDAIVTDMIQCA